MSTPHVDSASRPSLKNIIATFPRKSRSLASFILARKAATDEEVVMASGGTRLTLCTKMNRLRPLLLQHDYALRRTTYYRILPESNKANVKNASRLFKLYNFLKSQSFPGVTLAEIENELHLAPSSINILLTQLRKTSGVKVRREFIHRIVSLKTSWSAT